MRPDLHWRESNEDNKAGRYELVASIAHYLVFADPNNMEAREMEAAALEQLGYQAESGPARNAYLVGAQELRSTQPVQGRTAISADVMSAMSLSQLLDYLAVRLNSQKADGENFSMNLIINDTADKALIQVKNSVLSSVFERFIGMLDVFDPGFNIVLP